jgi:hypothetical protein
VRKEELLHDLIDARATFMVAIEGLTPDQMLRPGACGIWSVKDMLAHLTAWESELVTALNHAQQKKVPRLVKIDDVDGWNDEQYHENVRRPMDVILKDFEDVHQMLLRMVEAYNDKALFDNRRYPWMEGESLAFLVEDTATIHEREHAEEIMTWRTEQGI